MTGEMLVDPDLGDAAPEVEVTPYAAGSDALCGSSAGGLPTWFVAGLAAMVVFCAAAGVVGVLLLVVGWYLPGPVFVAAAAAASSTAVLVVRRRGPAPVSHACALAAVGVALGFFVVAGAFHSEHLLTERDPAVYVNTGRSIAGTHELHPVVRTGAFSDKTFSMHAAGFDEKPHGRLGMTFFPMLPVLLALGWSVGGDTGLLLVPALLGSLGVLACYALAARIVGPRASLFAPLVFLLEPLQLWFARDAYSELVVQVVVLGGLWLYLEAREMRSPSLAFAAGLVIASSELARVDALVVLVGVIAFATVDWMRCDLDRPPARSRRVVFVFFVPLAIGSLAAAYMMRNVANAYVHALHHEFGQTLTAFKLVIAAAVALVVLHRLRPGFGGWLASQWRLMAVAAVGASGIFGWAYWWRPEPARDLPVLRPGQELTGAIRQAMTDWHWSRSLHWFAAYIGFVAVVVAFIGLMVLGCLALRGRSAATALFLLATPVAVLYTARPSIGPDQPWAMRRYLPVVLPGIAIAIVVAFVTAWTIARRVRPVAARAASIVGIVGLAFVVGAPSAVALRPFLRARMQHGAESAIHELCRQAGKDSALLVYGYRYLNLELPQTLRGFCGVPVAVPANYIGLDLGALSTRWKLLGRRLLVATATPDSVKHASPGGAAIVARVVISDDGAPERVFDRRPAHWVPVRFDIWLLEITPTQASPSGGHARSG